MRLNNHECLIILIVIIIILIIIAIIIIKYVIALFQSSGLFIALYKLFSTFHNCLDFEKAYATDPREMAMATLRWRRVLDGLGDGRRHI